MAKLSSADLMAAFKEMTVVELSDFVKAFEEEFDVTAAAPVAVAVAGGAAAGGDAAAAQDAYNQYYNVLGYNKYMNDYFKQHGNLQGVDEKWGQYKDAYINQAKKDNPQYSGMIAKPTAPVKTKGEKQADIIRNDANKSVTDAADEILAKSQGH